MQRLSFNSLSEKVFDLIVIGGGITGAAIAHQASVQGLKVALFEMNDFGSATSAATSKLIHGGLRYLKNLELGLVRESLRERRVLGNIAANLVEPLRFVIPTYSGNASRKLALRAGLCLYDLLSYDKTKVPDRKNALSGHRVCTSDEVLKAAPMLDEQGLTGGICFSDYANINPDRMTLAFLKTAQDNGGELANYARVDGFLQDENTIVGVMVTDQLSEAKYQARADWVVNCCGAWGNEILSTAKHEPSVSRLRSEGVHIITAKIPCKQAVVLQTSTGEHLMFLPWRGLTIIGPTDRAYLGHASDYQPSRASLEELIEHLNAFLPAEKMGGEFTRRDILFHYGGLRPLVDADSSGGTYSASRRYEIVDHLKRDGLSGLISVEGGKYTSSRGLAEATLAVIAKRSKWSLKRVDTKRYPLHSCNIGEYANFLGSMIDRYEKRYPQQTIEYYVNNYGLEASQVLDLGLKNPDGMTQLTKDGEIMAEVDYVLAEEMVYTLSDLLLRRTGVGWMGRPPDSLMRAVASKLGSRLGWTPTYEQAAIERFIERFYSLP